MLQNPFRGKKRIERQFGANERPEFSLHQLHDLFLTSKRAEGLRHRTIKDHIVHFGYLSDWLIRQGFDPHLEGNLDIHKIRQYVGYMQTELKIKPSTINIRLKTLRCFLKFAFDEGYIETNLAHKVKLVKTDKDTVKTLSPEHVEALLKAIDTHCYSGYRMLLLDTGAKIN